jgi:hypothetical protein
MALNARLGESLARLPLIPKAVLHEAAKKCAHAVQARLHPGAGALVKT